MKKLILFLTLISILALAIPSVVFAAGTVTGVVSAYSKSEHGEIMRITYLVTFGSSAGSPANVALNLILTTSGTRLPALAGYWLLSIATIPGSTGPTDDTGITLWISSAFEDDIDILGSNGINAIDNTADNLFYPATSTQPLTGEEIFDIDGNSVNNATVSIVFTIYR